MTWIMLALLVGLLGLGTVLTLASARRMEADPATAATRERLLENITFPGAIPGTLGYAYSFGSILLAILAAAAVGGEYGWGTLRPALATGVPRGRFLAAKLLALAVVAAGYLVVTLAAGVGLAVPATVIADRAITLGTVDAAWFGHLALMLARTLLLLLVPMALAFFFGLLGRSQAVGIGASLGYLIGEGIGITILGLLGDWAQSVIRLSSG
ncbi:MAG: ABC transporter permease subunit [Chloroflexota bacterium]|nr:ABC transporter permease subunit [Chloroflexota bacterium]